MYAVFDRQKDPPTPWFSTVGVPGIPFGLAKVMGDPTMKYICWLIMTNNLQTIVCLPFVCVCGFFAQLACCTKDPLQNAHRAEKIGVCAMQRSHFFALPKRFGKEKRMAMGEASLREVLGENHCSNWSKFHLSLLTVRFTVLCISIHGLLWDKCGCVKYPNTGNFKQTTILVCWEGPIRVTSFISLVICKKQ